MLEVDMIELGMMFVKDAWGMVAFFGVIALLLVLPIALICSLIPSIIAIIIGLISR